MRASTKPDSRVARGSVLRSALLLDLCLAYQLRRQEPRLLGLLSRSLQVLEALLRRNFSLPVLCLSCRICRQAGARVSKYDPESRDLLPLSRVEIKEKACNFLKQLQSEPS